MTSEFEKEYIAARKAVIRREYEALNPMQQDAVLATEGPLLLLAGAGSGKTTVLIRRVANLLKYGRGSDCDEVPPDATSEDLAFLKHYPAHPTAEDEARARTLCAVDPARPWSIIAITFTNKAAGELKERLERMIGPDADGVWASTFHSACLRILRRDIERIGFQAGFTIYDSADSQRIIKDILKDFSYDEKSFAPRSVLNLISKAKDDMVLPDQFDREWVNDGDWRMERIGRIYREYVKRLHDANALDFDDIILHTVTLLQENEDIRAYYQDKFHYVLIDEYQDTNNLQYRLATLLAGQRKNICVVGDDDQSIYRFRGANIENILNFESEYQTARVIRLEQNYRSTQNILDSANAVIRHNTGRKGKTLWTKNGAGDKVQIRTLLNEQAEADFVVGDIFKAYGAGRPWHDNAILYRMNAQSNQLEYAMKRNGVPYRIIGGIRFFDRAEVKDMLAYLCAVNNPSDDLRLRRIINNPPRGIGVRTVETVQEIAAREGIPMFQVIMSASQYPELSRSVEKLFAFATMLIEMQGKAEALPLDIFYDEVCTDSGYLAALEGKRDEESRGRAENVKELRSNIVSFMETHPGTTTLSGFLDEIALYTDLDEQSSDDCVVMMTMHSAKGLEFPAVYVVGLEENIFPGSRSICEPEEMEEERRLCYVAMTRAKKILTMTNARQRMLFGRTTTNPSSRFLSEVPEKNCIRHGRGNALPETSHTFHDFDPLPYSAPDTRSTGYGSSHAAHSNSGSTVNRGSSIMRDMERGRANTALLSLKEGDMVRHSAFGRGMVLSARAVGGDVLAEIAFDEVGTRRLLLKSAGAFLTKL